MYLTTLAFKFSTAIPYHLRKCYVLVNEVKFTYDYLHSRSLNKWMSLLCLPAEFSFPVKCRIAHLRQRCHNPKFVIFQEKILKILKCYNFLWVQRQHSCSPAASFANCIMTIYLLKVHLQTFLSTPVTQKCQIFSCDTLVANERYNLCLILKTVLQKSCHQYNCNLTRFSTAFTNI